MSESKIKVKIENENKKVGKQYCNRIRLSQNDFIMGVGKEGGGKGTPPRHTFLRDFGAPVDH